MEYSTNEFLDYFDALSAPDWRCYEYLVNEGYIFPQVHEETQDVSDELHDASKKGTGQLKTDDTTNGDERVSYTPLSISQYPHLHDKEKGHKWIHRMIHAACEQNVQDILNPDYIPETIDDSLRLTENSLGLFYIFKNTIHIEEMRNMILLYEKSIDATYTWMYLYDKIMETYHGKDVDGEDLPGEPNQDPTTDGDDDDPHWKRRVDLTRLTSNFESRHMIPQTTIQSSSTYVSHPTSLQESFSTLMISQSNGDEGDRNTQLANLQKDFLYPMSVTDQAEWLKLPYND